MAIAHEPRTAATHAVDNQAPPLAPLDLFSTHTALVEALEREGGGWAHDRAVAAGQTWGDVPLRVWGEQANVHEPVLRTHDRYGHRIDEVEFHPAWHELMRLARAHELHALPWTSDEDSPHVARAALFMTAGQAEAGFCCPTTMTFAAVPALRATPELAAVWEPRLTSTGYEPELAPIDDKRAAVAGMSMTEKQGGSDVRANTTTASELDDGTWVLRGHKWFTSAPMSDLFLTLAQGPAGLSCFAVPRVLPDGTRNPFALQRLKDKLGNRSNASSEVEYDGTIGWLVGEEGRGVATILEMVGHTRLDCVLGSAAGMRRAVAEATWHCAHRAAFGRTLADQPLMANVLADLAIEAEAATVLAMRLARAYDESDHAIRRLGTAIAKFHVCKRFAPLAAEALECLGGNGYVEESGMPRIYREAPLNSVWEGSGNVNALDVLRALAREPQLIGALLAELDLARGADTRLDAELDALRKGFSGTQDELEAGARRLVERLCVAWQASLLHRNAPHAVADAFCAGRLGGGGGMSFGTLPAGLDLGTIVARATPQPVAAAGAAR